MVKWDYMAMFGRLGLFRNAYVQMVVLINWIKCLVSFPKYCLMYTTVLHLFGCRNSTNLSMVSEFPDCPGMTVPSGRVSCQYSCDINTLIIPHQGLRGPSGVWFTLNLSMITTRSHDMARFSGYSRYCMRLLLWMWISDWIILKCCLKSNCS